MARTKVWYGLAILIAALGPMISWVAVDNFAFQSMDVLAALILIPILLVAMLLIAALGTPGVRIGHRLAGIGLATWGLVAWGFEFLAHNLLGI